MATKMKELFEKGIRRYWRIEDLSNGDVIDRVEDLSPKNMGTLDEYLEDADYDPECEIYAKEFVIDENGKATYTFNYKYYAYGVWH